MDTADKAGLGLGRYWRIENSYAEPTPAECSALASALDVLPSELFAVPNNNAGATA